MKMSCEPHTITRQTYDWSYPT